MVAFSCSMKTFYFYFFSGASLAGNPTNSTYCKNTRYLDFVKMLHTSRFNHRATSVLSLCMFSDLFMFKYECLCGLSGVCRHDKALRFIWCICASLDWQTLLVLDTRAACFSKNSLYNVMFKCHIASDHSMQNGTFLSTH